MSKDFIQKIYVPKFIPKIGLKIDLEIVPKIATKNTYKIAP